VVVVVVGLRGGLWGCLGEVWLGGRGLFGLRFGVGTVYGWEIYGGGWCCLGEETGVCWG